MAFFCSLRRFARHFRSLVLCLLRLKAEDVAGKLLRAAGCNASSIFTTPLRGTHPSGTVPVGKVLSADLRTEVENLYVCDASVFPEALGRPTVLTILALGRRLARQLNGRLTAEARRSAEVPGATSVEDRIRGLSS